MAYQLVFSNSLDTAGKDLGRNVFLNDLPEDYPVYIFYYPGAMPQKDLESALRSLGKISGKNLFVNLGKLDDPGYAKIAGHFQIKKLPVIVMTAIGELASAPDSPLSTYVRIDSKDLLGSPEKTTEVLQKLFNLFLTGQVVEALKEAKKDDRNAMLASFGRVAARALEGVWKFVSGLEISFSIAEGKFELKHS